MQTNKKKEIEALDSEIDFIDMNIYPVDFKGSPGIEFRKLFTYCEKNKKFIKQIIEASLNNEQKIITVPVSIKFNNKLKAIEKLREMGIEIEYKSL